MTIIYVARMDVNQSFMSTFEKWYDTKHAPDLLNSGFHSCSVYYASSGEPVVHNVYMIPSVDIFGSEKYLSARNPKIDTLRPTVLNNVSNRSNTPYKQITVLNAKDSAVPKSSQLLSLQFNSRDDSDSIRERFMHVFAKTPNIVRLCQRHGSHINASTDADWYILVQIEDPSNSSSEILTNMIGNNDFDVSQQILNHRITFVC